MNPQSPIQFHVGDGDSLPYLLSKLIGHTITVTLKNERYVVGDIVNPYSEGGRCLSITKHPMQGDDSHTAVGTVELDYDFIDSIEYA